MSEFSPKGYISLLEAAIINSYEFYFFPEIKNINAQLDKKVCLLRHDIDADVGAALKMAKLERDIGVNATYFLMLRSPIYNLFSRQNHLMVQEIMSLGHEIGLHFDGGFKANRSLDLLQNWINDEIEFFEKQFCTRINVVSFHQPDDSILKGDLNLYRGRINTYNKDDIKGFEYISDSNRHWKNRPPQKVFSDSTFPKIQLLIHPIWWMFDNHISTDECWNTAIINNLHRNQLQLLQTERAFGEKRQFVIKNAMK